MFGLTLSQIILIVALLASLSVFLVAGALDPPSRLKTRPATATEIVRR